jgi:hypothetical protein
MGYSVTRLRIMDEHLTIIMTLNRYDLFVEKLDPASRAYEIMKNASIERSDSKDHYVGAMRIACRSEEADMLLDQANRLCPEAAPDIASAIDSIDK